MRRRLRRGLTSLKGAAGDEAKACLVSAMQGVPQGTMLEFAISVYMMVQASPEDRALYIFSILDTDGNKQVFFLFSPHSPCADDAARYSKPYFLLCPGSKPSNVIHSHTPGL